MFLEGVIFVSKTVRARYEKGVLRLLDKVDLEDGEEVLVSIKRNIRSILRKYRGALGKASLDEILQLEEEAHIQ